MIPSLGSFDKKENQSQKILAKAQSQLNKKVIRKDDERNEDPKKKFNEEQLEKEIDKEKKILIKLLDCIVYLDKNISFINSRRTQYQKG